MTNVTERSRSEAERGPMEIGGLRDLARRRGGLEYLGVAALLIGTAVAYLWNLSANGWANSYYAAAVQAGTISWKAFFFGSLDAANSITVDKTPASLWLMELSARIFGLSSWSMLLPEVLLGVASVGLLWATVRRGFGPVAGLLAGSALAVTPVAALMFRFNNPDALLVFCMVAAVWAMMRAVDSGCWRWLVACGLIIGFGFLAKQLQVLLVLPALVLVYLLAGPPKLGKRIAQLFAAGAAMVAGAGWWVLAAQLWPSDARPYFGGSEHNSIIELTLGYNGVSRLNGGGFPGLGSGTAGIGRLFNSHVGGQIAWLIPAALILLVAGLVLRGRAPRTDRQRAILLVFGVWLGVAAVVFSFMSGIFHEYYTVSLAPAIAVTAGAGAVLSWRERERLWVRFALAGSMLATGATAWVLLSRTGDFVPWLRWFVAAGAVLAAGSLLLRTSGRSAMMTALIAVVVSLAAPAAYSVETLNTAHTGTMPIAGPQSASSDPAMGGSKPEISAEQSGGTAIQGSAADAAPSADSSGGAIMFGVTKAQSAEVLRLLETDSDSYTWVLATTGSGAQATYQLETGLPVMSIGGFSGGDPSPTLAKFQQYVKDGRIHYFLADGFGAKPGYTETSEAQKISEWVQQHYMKVEVDGTTFYDLTQPLN